MAPSLYASCLKASANIGRFFLMCKFFAKKNCFNLNFTRYTHFVAVLMCGNACLCGEICLNISSVDAWGVAIV